jgi:hypothetical protein
MIRAVCFALVIAFAVIVTAVQCSIADDCRAEGGTPVRGATRAVECIKFPGGKP